MYEAVSNIPAMVLFNSLLIIFLLALLAFYFSVLQRTANGAHATIRAKLDYLRILILSFYLSLLAMALMALTNFAQFQVFHLLGNYLLIIFALAIHALHFYPKTLTPLALRPKGLGALFIACMIIFGLILPRAEHAQLRATLVCLTLGLLVGHTLIDRLRRKLWTQPAQQWVLCVLFVLITFFAVHAYFYRSDTSTLSVALINVLLANALIWALLQECRTMAADKEHSTITQQPPINAPIEVSNEPIPDASNRIVGSYQRWVRVNYADVEASVEQAIKEIGTSHATLNRHLKKCDLPTSKKILNDFRLAQATRELENKKPSEVAYSCGFKTPSHFAQAFKAKYGQTPSEFRSGKV